jgi:hypothetical protein
LRNIISKLADIKEYKSYNSIYIKSKAKLTLNDKNIGKYCPVKRETVLKGHKGTF